MSVLKVFGHATSQPTRAVLWLCSIKKLPVELIKVDPMKGENKSKEFRSKFPIGLIPAIEDGDFRLGESNAILSYLCRKHDWNDFYPKNNEKRAKIDEYLHFHHHHSRVFSGVLFRPTLFTILLKQKFPDPPREKQISSVRKAAKILENFLESSPFLANSQQPTIADLAAYCELDQIFALNKAGFDLFDFNPYPNILKWSERMEKFDQHDQIRKTLFKTVELVAKQSQQIKANL
mmetsp:Transcript_20295/g.34644  ORF Transcript_20295/g.34644 Transcript_20295/m.34644 type:complete len:234 (+) Transcript_20295:90-791(+)